jgi:nucleotide-binding universal stress UspA family protein
MPYGSDIVEIERNKSLAEAGRCKQIFEEAARGHAFVAEWRVIESRHPDIGRAIVEQARAADLVIAGQTDPKWDLSPIFDIPERLALESGRPVLVVPYAGSFGEVGKRVVVAWNNRREASRAVFDALPLLAGADQVRVLWINPARDGVAPDELPTAEITGALARHGVKAEAAHSVAPDIDVGNELLSRAADLSADLIVMGCYGRSRFRELIFGGATRHILQHMTVPVLLSH